MRIGLVIWTLLATAWCVGSLLTTQTQQEEAAAAYSHGQDLLDLKAGIAWAHSAGLVLLTDQDNPTFRRDFNEANRVVDRQLVACASSSLDLEAMSRVATAVRAWQSLFASTLAAGELPDDFTVSDLDGAYQSVRDSLAAADTSLSFIYTYPSIIGAIVASVLGALGFIVVSIMTARRSRRVINVGLTLGLLAVIATIMVGASYAKQYSNVYTDNDQLSYMIDAKCKMWSSRGVQAMSEYPPYLGSGSTGQESLDRARSYLDKANEQFAQEMTGYLATIEQALKDDNITSQDPWIAAATAIDDKVDTIRLNHDDIVTPATGYVIAVSVLGIVAVICLLVGISARTKEYR
jgi:hypothetical protein